MKPPPPNLRPLDAPSPLRVRVDSDGRPVEVRLARGKAERVAVVRETWRIDDEWWRQPISRLYHEMVLENGKLVTLYLDLIEGGWWRQ